MIPIWRASTNPLAKSTELKRDSNIQNEPPDELLEKMRNQIFLTQKMIKCNETTNITKQSSPSKQDSYAANLPISKSNSEIDGILGIDCRKEDKLKQKEKIHNSIKELNHFFLNTKKPNIYTRQRVEASVCEVHNRNVEIKPSFRSSKALKQEISAFKVVQTGESKNIHKDLVKGLFVANLPYSLNQQQIKDIFKSDEIEKIVLVLKAKGNFAGYAFVHLKSAEKVHEIIEHYNGLIVNNHKIRVFELPSKNKAICSEDE